MKKQNLTAWTLAFVMAASTSWGAAVSFSRVDRNNDRVITPEEAEYSLKGLNEVQFKKCDRDKSGTVEQNEFGCLKGIYDAFYANED